VGTVGVDSQGDQPVGQWRAAADACRGESDDCAPAGLTGEWVPTLELATWLDRYVDAMVRASQQSGDPRAAEQRVDVMVGLSRAAEAFRAADRCDRELAEQHLRSAVELLQGVDLEQFAL
jgi:hypothetical protein